MRTILFLLASAAALMAQSTPSAVDCRFTDTFTSATTGAARINDTVGTPCVAWRVTVNTSGFSGFSIQFETSPDNITFTAVPNNICSSVVPPPCVIDGGNPDTTTGSSTFSVKAYGKFIRLNVTSVTGSGTINTNTLGYKGLSANGSGSTSGGGLLDPGGNGIVVRTSVNVTAPRTITAGSGIGVTNGSGVGGNPTISLVPLTTFQIFPWGNIQLNNGNTFAINSAHNVYVWPFMLSVNCTLGHIVYHIAAVNPSSSNSIAFAIYDSTKTLIGQTTPDTFTGSPNTYRSSAMASAQTIGPGLFYFAFSADNTTVSFSLDNPDTISNQYMNVTAQRTGSCANTSTGTGTGLTFPGTCGVVTDLTFNALPSVALEN